MVFQATDTLASKVVEQFVTCTCSSKLLHMSKLIMWIMLTSHMCVHYVQVCYICCTLEHVLPGAGAGVEIAQYYYEQQVMTCVVPSLAQWVFSEHTMSRTFSGQYSAI